MANAAEKLKTAIKNRDPDELVVEFKRGSLENKSGRDFVIYRVTLTEGEYKTAWIDNVGVKHCLRCEVPWSFPFNFKHHCRKCGYLVCGSCSPHKMNIPSAGEPGDSRVCTFCFEGGVMPDEIAGAAVILDEDDVFFLNSMISEEVTNEPTEINFSREFKNVDKYLLYKACTESEHLIQWWSGNSTPIVIDSLDVKKDGKFIYHTEINGEKTYSAFQFKYVIPNGQLDFISGYCNENGEFISLPHNDNFPKWMSNDWIFKDDSNKAILEVRGWPINANPTEMSCFKQKLDVVVGNLNDSFDKLEAYLATL